MNDYILPFGCFFVGVLGCIGVNGAGYLMLSDVNQSLPKDAQIKWSDRSFIFKIWKSDRVKFPASPLRKLFIVAAVLMVGGWFSAFATLPAANSANAR